MFHSVIPIIPLQPFIESIWYCSRFVDKPEHTLTLPFGRIEMVIKFSGDYSLVHQQSIFKGKDLWITGQQTKSTITTITGQHECMGVVFTPLGWTAFSDIWAGELINRSVFLPDLWGKDIGRLRDELQEIKPVEIKFDKLQQFFLKRMTAQKNLSIIREALHIIQINGNEKKITVNDLCKQLKTSRKSLNQHFQKYIGLSASAYLQQVVFNAVLKDICNMGDERLIGIGYEYHFFDQAHFIKQFQSLSGITPGQYLRLVKNETVDKAFPNFLAY